MLKLTFGFFSQGIRAQTTGNDAMIAKEAGYIGEICRGTPEARPLGKEIPEEFTESSDREVSSRWNRKRRATGHGNLRRVERGMSELGSERWA